MKIVLFEPEIPQNTGNISRTCAVLGAELHLIEPLGFSLEEKMVRRAGLDYWHMVTVVTHPSIAAFFSAYPDLPGFYVSTKAKTALHPTALPRRLRAYFRKRERRLAGNSA